MNEKYNKATKDNPKMPPKPECGRYLGCIYFYLTEGCNLKCRHCWIEPPFESKKKPEYPYVDFKTFRHIVDQGLELGLISVKLTGGEPLIHPDIGRIIQYIHKKKLNLNIETNGTVLTPSLAKLIMSTNQRIVLSISLDSHRAEIHEWVRGVKGSFEAALRGIRYMTDVGYKPQIIMSVMRRNAGHIENLVRLAEALGAGSVKFNPVTPTARGEKLHARGEALSIEELIELGRFVDQKLQPCVKVNLFFSHPGAFRSMSNMRTRCNISGCGIFRSIGVLGTGKYALCGIGESLPEFVFGDARFDTLKEIWNNTPLLNEIRTGLITKLSGVCGDCLLKAGCLGLCVANNYNYSKTLFAPNYYCQSAYEAGLFPKSRLVPGSKYDLEYQAI